MNFPLEHLVRPNIRALEPYSCARDEYDGDDALFLDANESPFDTGLNRYPDPHQRALKKALSALKGVPADRIVLGNGSDEIIDIVIRSVCRPGRDNIVVFSPGYSMYEVAAHINDVQVRRLDLTADFQPDWAAAQAVTDADTKAVFVVSPNNPVGAPVPLADIEAFCARFPAFVVVDEAYADFSDGPSAATLLDKYPNLIVLQTLSKSWGMASLRLGMCFAHPYLAGVFSKVKAPYNVGGLTQRTALEVLADYPGYRERMEEIKRQRERLRTMLQASPLFERVLPSQANFILATSPHFRALYRYLTENKVVVRLRDIPPLIAGGMRITVGTQQQNDRLEQLLRDFQAGKAPGEKPCGAQRKCP